VNNYIYTLKTCHQKEFNIGSFDSTTTWESEVRWFCSETCICLMGY